MKRHFLHFASTVCLSIFALILLNAAFIGFTTRPAELDSIKYHIPIAKSYLDGRIFSSPDSPILHKYFPGASEGILALFIIAHIPLNLYNILAAAALAGSLYLLGKRAGLRADGSIVFAAGFSSLTAISRWLNVQIVDIWFAVFYALTLYLLLKPEKKASYFLKLGCVLGMVVGSKYSGPLYAGILLIFFGRGLIRSLTFKNAVSLTVPVLVLGGFWYLRNLLVMNNPVYPLSVFGFPGVKNWALDVPVWKAVFSYPGSMASALVSEYLGWSLVLIGAPVYLVYAFAKKRFSPPFMFVLLGLLNILAYLPLPNGEGYRVHVSNLRYSYPIFIPLVLAAFIWFKDRKTEEGLAVFSLASMLMGLQLPYHPKLILAFVPILLVLWKMRGKNSA